MVKIRLRRMGAKKTGAQPTDTVRALLKKVDVL